jgi:hypothetical protein
VTVQPGTNCATNCLQVECPSNIVVTSCTNVQEFYAPTVTDSCCSNWTLVCTPPSGSYFAPNTTTVVDCFVTDYCGMSNSCSFAVTVQLGPNCSSNCITLNCPSNIVVTTCSNCAVPYTYIQDVLTRLPNMTNHQVPEVTPAAWVKAHLQVQRQATS